MRRRTLLGLGVAAVASGWPRRSPARSRSVAAKIVIVGGGFAGAGCALALRRLDPAIEVTVVDPDERYVTCPMSNSVLVGLRDLESLSVSRDGLRRAGVTYVRDHVVAIDMPRREARLGRGNRVPFDRLVMAAGIRLRWGRPQGYTEEAARLMPHAWQAGPQTELLASQLRAIRNGGVVAISVPAGPMRCPPAPFERASLIAGFLQREKARCKILIFDANNQFPRQDSFTDAWAALYPGMIEWISVVDGGAVVRVEPATMTLYTERRAQQVDVANVIPPQAPALLAAQVGLAAEHGWCPVDPQTFESRLIAGVYVIGDACIAAPMPKSASAAHAQAKQCAAAIMAALSGRPAPEALLDSVCYSLVAPATALAIHGRFHASGGVIEQLPAGVSSPTPNAQDARAGEDWYARIVADSFGG